MKIFVGNSIVVIIFEAFDDHNFAKIVITFRKRISVKNIFKKASYSDYHSTLLVILLSYEIVMASMRSKLLKPKFLEMFF